MNSVTIVFEDGSKAFWGDLTDSEADIVSDFMIVAFRQPDSVGP